MSDVLVYLDKGSGLFSLFHRALEILVGHLDSHSINRFKIRIQDSSFFVNKHIFDNIFDCNGLQDELEILTASKIVKFIKVLDSPHYDVMRSIVSKNKLSPILLNKVEHYKEQFKIDVNTLAIHIRLTDMNVYHVEDHGYRSFGDYCTKLNEMLEKYTNINSIYIMSDNMESIQKLKNMYSDKYKVNYIIDNIRPAEEEGNCLNFVINQYNTEPDIEIKIFTEILIASACSYFIYRVSDVANFTILYSNTFKAIECLN